MQVFVTGANGFIGGAVAAALIAAGHKVRGPVRNKAKAGAVDAFRYRVLEIRKPDLADDWISRALARTGEHMEIWHSKPPSVVLRTGARLEVTQCFDCCPPNAKTTGWGPDHQHQELSGIRCRCPPHTSRPQRGERGPGAAGPSLTRKCAFASAAEFCSMRAGELGCVDCWSD